MFFLCVQVATTVTIILVINIINDSPLYLLILLFQCLCHPSPYLYAFLMRNQYFVCRKGWNQGDMFVDHHVLPTNSVRSCCQHATRILFYSKHNVTSYATRVLPKITSLTITSQMSSCGMKQTFPGFVATHSPYRTDCTNSIICTPSGMIFTVHMYRDSSV